MTNKNMSNNKIIKKLSIWAVIIFGILMIPFTTQMPWTKGDYLFAGSVLFILATVYELTTKNMKKLSNRLIVGVILIIVIFMIIGWAATGPD